MTKFLIGFVLGIFVATVGVGGVLKVFDHGVDQVKQTSKELAK